MDTSSNEFQAFLRVHENIPRQGPGSEDSTKRALRAVGPLPAQPVIYDMGCGPGKSLIVLASTLKQRVIGVDREPDFINQAKATAALHGLSDLVDAQVGDMLDVELPPSS